MYNTRLKRYFTIIVLGSCILTILVVIFHVFNIASLYIYGGVLILFFTLDIPLTIIYTFVFRPRIELAEQKEIERETLSNEYSARITTIIEKCINDKESFYKLFEKHIREIPSENKYFSTINLVTILTLMDGIHQPGECIAFDDIDIKKLIERLEHYEQTHAGT